MSILKNAIPCHRRAGARRRRCRSVSGLCSLRPPARPGLPACAGGARGLSSLPPAPRVSALAPTPWVSGLCSWRHGLLVPAVPAALRVPGICQPPRPEGRGLWSSPPSPGSLVFAVGAVGFWPVLVAGAAGSWPLPSHALDCWSLPAAPWVSGLCWRRAPRMSGLCPPPPPPRLARGRGLWFFPRRPVPWCLPAAPWVAGCVQNTGVYQNTGARAKSQCPCPCEAEIMRGTAARSISGNTLVFLRC